MVRHRLLHAILIDLPQGYSRARGTFVGRHLIFVHSIFFVFHRRDFGNLEPWTHAEGRAEAFVTRSDLQRSFGMSISSEAGSGAGEDGVEEKSDVVRCTPEEEAK